MPELPRFGINMRLPKEFDSVTWFGRGPHENYCDRKTSAFVGLYRQSVDELFEPYISPQENGYRTDTRWVLLRDEECRGIMVGGKPLLGFSALWYTADDLTQPERGSRNIKDLKKRDFIDVNIDLKQMGVGGDNSWGALPHPQYQLPYKEYEFKFFIMPTDRHFEPMDIYRKQSE